MNLWLVSPTWYIARKIHFSSKAFIMSFGSLIPNLPSYVPSNNICSSSFLYRDKFISWSQESLYPCMNLINIIFTIITPTINTTMLTKNIVDNKWPPKKKTIYELICKLFLKYISAINHLGHEGWSWKECQGAWKDPLDSIENHSNFQNGFLPMDFANKLIYS